MKASFSDVFGTVEAVFSAGKDRQQAKSDCHPQLPGMKTPFHISIKRLKVRVYASGVEGTEASCATEAGSTNRDCRPLSVAVWRSSSGSGNHFHRAARVCRPRSARLGSKYGHRLNAYRLDFLGLDGI